MLNNAFVNLGDWGRAQQIADGFHIERLHRKLDEFAGRFCPIHRALGQSYHWSAPSPSNLVHAKWDNGAHQVEAELDDNLDYPSGPDQEGRLLCSFDSLRRVNEVICRWDINFDIISG